MEQQQAERVLPRDEFSRRRRELQENPGALGSGSTIHLQDFYGNLETWVLETFRFDGSETAFLQRSSTEGHTRVALPPEVMAALRRHQDSIDKRVRRRAARQALATKREAGQTIGNPKALAKARKARRKR